MLSLNINKRVLIIAATSMLSACSNVRLQSPEELGKGVIDMVHRQQSQQQCASGGDPYARLRCERQAQQQMQQHLKDQQKNTNE